MGMDPQRFDRWTRQLHSRRTAVSALGGLGVGLGFGARRPTVAAPTPANHGKGQAFGCTKADNACKIDSETPCPDAPAGVCAVNHTGKPTCVSAAPCHACKRNRDCVATYGPTAQCIKCWACTQFAEVRTACIVPFAA